MRRSLILLILSDKKKNESTQYTLDEMKSEIDSLSSPQGKTIIFRNLDESGGQKFIVTKTMTDSELEGSSQDLVVDPPNIKYNFYLRCHPGYIPGEIDHVSPVNYNDLEDGHVITAQPGYLASSTERQLVDMTEYLTINFSTATEPVSQYSNRYRFTQSAIDYFKTVKPTNLHRGLASNSLFQTDTSVFNLLDTSECTNFNSCFAGLALYDLSGEYNTYANLNLSNWDMSKATDIGSMFKNFDCNILDISNWDISSVIEVGSLFYSAKINTIIGLDKLDVSKLPDLGSFLYMANIKNYNEIMDLSSWKNNIATSISNFAQGLHTKVLDISNIDTSHCAYMSNAFYSSYIEEVRGVIDLSSIPVNNIYSMNNIVNINKLKVPIKFKNIPSDFPSTWWQTAGFTSEGQFEIVT